MLDSLISAPDGPGFEGHVGEHDLLTLDDARRFFKKHWKLIARSTGIAIIGAAGYIMAATPMFTATVQLLIERDVPLPFREERGQVSEAYASLDTPQVESQIAILKSQEIAQKVNRRLNLLDVPEPSPRASLIDNLLSWLPRWKVEASTDKLQAAIVRIQSGLDARREGLSYVINISYSAADALSAANTANAVADAYVDDQLETRMQTATQGSKWLEERIDALRKQMNAAQLDVQQFKARRDYRIVDTQNDATVAKTDRGTIAGNAQPGHEEDKRTLEELQSRADTYRKAYEIYLQAYAESVQRQSYPVTNARVISRATPPSHKSRPRTLLTLALGAVVGMLAGLGISLVLNGLEHKRLPSDEGRLAMKGP